ncbi:hypothetical protein KSP40_PGU021373 [Platanthera guangdongensis]|uniref:Uncharacterized protein n=1 Tax=Platanthera guangdongensis TaxID=2320717 RepID=A0ABR2MEP9_9ASPA
MARGISKSALFSELNLRKSKSVQFNELNLLILAKLAPKMSIHFNNNERIRDSFQLTLTMIIDNKKIKYTISHSVSNSNFIPHHESSHKNFTRMLSWSAIRYEIGVATIRSGGAGWGRFTRRNATSCGGTINELDGGAESERRAGSCLSATIRLSSLARMVTAHERIVRLSRHGMLSSSLNICIGLPHRSLEMADYNPEHYLWEWDFTLAGRKYKRQDLEASTEIHYRVQSLCPRSVARKYCYTLCDLLPWKQKRNDSCPLRGNPPYGLPFTDFPGRMRSSVGGSTTNMQLGSWSRPSVQRFGLRKTHYITRSTVLSSVLRVTEIKWAAPTWVQLETEWPLAGPMGHTCPRPPSPSPTEEQKKNICMDWHSRGPSGHTPEASILARLNPIGGGGEDCFPNGGNMNNGQEGSWKGTNVANPSNLDRSLDAPSTLTRLDHGPAVGDVEDVARGAGNGANDEADLSSYLMPGLYDDLWTTTVLLDDDAHPGRRNTLMTSLLHPDPDPLEFMRELRRWTHAILSFPSTAAGLPPIALLPLQRPRLLQ